MSSHSSTPAKSTHSSGGSKAQPKSSTSRFNRSPPPLFTPLMQDAQARNKDPHNLSTDSSDSPYEAQGGRFDAYGNDTYENIQKRRMAAIILDSPELLMMHAQGRFDSIPGTRNHFMKIMCGYFDPNDKDDSLEPPTEKEMKNYKLKPWKEESSSGSGKR